jgi:hypothetical protein
MDESTHSTAKPTCRIGRSADGIFGRAAAWERGASGRRWVAAVPDQRFAPQDTDARRRMLRSHVSRNNPTRCTFAQRARMGAPQPILRTAACVSSHFPTVSPAQLPPDVEQAHNMHAVRYRRARVSVLLGLDSLPGRFARPCKTGIATRGSSGMTPILRTDGQRPMRFAAGAARAGLTGKRVASGEMCRQQRRNATALSHVSRSSSRAAHAVGSHMTRFGAMPLGQPHHLSLCNVRHVAERAPIDVQAPSWG